jgi:hypothetical protein
MLHRVALVRTDVSEERIASIRVRIGELGTQRKITANVVRSEVLTAVTMNTVVF